MKVLPVCFPFSRQSTRHAQDVLKQLFGAAMAEDDPDRREAIMGAISRILHSRERNK
jgi:hypothetical protein